MSNKDPSLSALCRHITLTLTGTELSTTIIGPGAAAKKL